MNLPETEEHAPPRDQGHLLFAEDVYEVRMHEDLELIHAEWDRLGRKNVFMHSDYLRALHQAPPQSMQFYYCTIWQGGALCGIVYTQLGVFRAQQSISYHKDEQLQEQKPGFLKRLRNALAARIRIHTLVCGNSLVTGEHGYLFSDRFNAADKLRIIDRILHELILVLKKRGIRVRLLFAKDFLEPVTEKLQMREDRRPYFGFHAQPNMILHVDPSWHTFDDYLAALSSKYRVRVRRAFKKAKGVVRRELTIADLEKHRDKIIEYYRDIAENASFNLFILNPDYFIAVKTLLGDRFRIFGFFVGDKLIAFYSLMINGEEVEAHFLGYEEETNKEYQLYHNMLLEMIALSIPLRVKRIIYGRTAMEIKSSVGAEPYLMYFYLQYQHALISRFVPWIYHTLEPEVRWVQRNPFKESEET